MLTLSLFLSVWTAAASAAEPKPAFNKVLIVVLENTDLADALAQPFMAELAKKGGLLKDYRAVRHPSQPNYIAMIAGSTHGVSSDRNHTLDQPHIGGLLDKAGKTWKAYAEDYPGNCFLGKSSGSYVRKHVPFLSFKDVQKDPAKCGRVVEASAFAADLKAGTLPDYAMYIPDMNNDGHDTGVSFADKWLAKTFGPVLKDPALPSDLLIVFTFDEDSTSGGDNTVYTVLYGAGVAPGSVSVVRTGHYSLLRTIEDALGLGTLGLEDAKADPISGVWKK